MSTDPTHTEPRLSIAIVDDEELVRISLRRLCRALGLAAIVYASGSELIEAIDARETRPDCVLLDAHMPNKTGLEVQQQLVGRDFRDVVRGLRALQLFLHLPGAQCCLIGSLTLLYGRARGFTWSDRLLRSTRRKEDKEQQQSRHAMLSGMELGTPRHSSRLLAQDERQSR